MTTLNTEPVRTTMRGIAAFIAGAAALTQAIVMTLNEVLKWQGGAPLPDSLGAALVTLVTVAVGIYSNVVGAERLRDKVTPWSPEAGAAVPAPAAPVPVAGGAPGGEEPPGIG